MIRRPYWIGHIEEAWAKRPIVWVAGVRRVGKTTLAKMLPDVVYLNCDLPSVARRLEDPELFYRSQPKGARILLDEVHRLADPAGVLKIAADAYPHLRVLATGSSTLAATRKFRDALTGRKAALYLPPVLWTECLGPFGLADIDRRLLHGGLPEPMLAEERDDDYFAEWMDSFYARDIQELFGIRERAGFLDLLRLMMLQSGGLVDYTRLARGSGLSRPTVKAHLEAMTVACALYPLRPFHGGGRRELVRRPKVYAFDTGFVAYVQGWSDIRDNDRGLLWEHLVLDTLRTCASDDALFYWRDKSGREVDFVRRRRGAVDAIECKINPDRFSPRHLQEFRRLYPQGENLLVCPGVDAPYERRYGEQVVRVTGCAQLLNGVS